MVKAATPVVLVPNGAPVTPVKAYGTPVTIVGPAAVLRNGVAYPGILVNGVSKTVTATVVNGTITAIVTA